MGRAAEFLGFPHSDIIEAQVIVHGEPTVNKEHEIYPLGYTGGQVDYETANPALVGSLFGSIAFGRRYNTEGLGVIEGPEAKVFKSRADIEKIMDNPTGKVGLWAAIGERMQQIEQEEYKPFWVDLGLEFEGLGYKELFEIEERRAQYGSEHGPSWRDFDIQLPGLGTTVLFGDETKASGFLLGPIGQQRVLIRRKSSRKRRNTRYKFSACKN